MQKEGSCEHPIVLDDSPRPVKRVAPRGVAEGIDFMALALEENSYDGPLPPLAPPPRDYYLEAVQEWEEGKARLAAEPDELLMSEPWVPLRLYEPDPRTHGLQPNWAEPFMRPRPHGRKRFGKGDPFTNQAAALDVIHAIVLRQAFRRTDEEAIERAARQWGRVQAALVNVPYVQEKELLRRFMHVIHWCTKLIWVLY